MTIPILTFTSNISPYSQLNSIAYIDEMEDGTPLPVNQDESSTSIIFRIYNNWALAAGVANALGVNITTFDGAGSVASHTASTTPISQMWIHVLQNGYGENSSQPGLYTVYTGTDTAVGGTLNTYIIERGSDGTSTPYIRAGSNNNGLGFIEVKTYATVPINAATANYTFALTVEFNWFS